MLHSRSCRPCHSSLFLFASLSSAGSLMDQYCLSRYTIRILCPVWSFFWDLHISDGHGHLRHPLSRPQPIGSADWYDLHASLCGILDWNAGGWGDPETWLASATDIHEYSFVSCHIRHSCLAVPQGRKHGSGEMLSLASGNRSIRALGSTL